MNHLCSGRPCGADDRFGELVTQGGAPAGASAGPGLAQVGPLGHEGRRRYETGIRVGVDDRLAGLVAYETRRGAFGQNERFRDQVWSRRWMAVQAGRLHHKTLRVRYNPKFAVADAKRPMPRLFPLMDCRQ